jgi:hypothetical protein
MKGTYGVPVENGNGQNGYFLQARNGTASAWITIQNHNGGKVFLIIYFYYFSFKIEKKSRSFFYFYKYLNYR